MKYKPNRAWRTIAGAAFKRSAPKCQLLRCDPNVPCGVLSLAWILVGCWTAHATTNLAAVVLAEARFQRDLTEVKRELPSALNSAALVVRARVLKPDSAVEASPKQREVSTGQGWRAALVQATHVFKGDQQESLLWIANGAFRADGLHWRFPIEATNGQQCILVLEKDKQLSRWCQTNVFAVMRGLEVE